MEDRSNGKKFNRSEKPGRGRKPYQSNRRSEERSFDPGNRYNSDKQDEGEQERKPFRSRRGGEEKSYNANKRYNSDKRNEGEQERKPYRSNRRGQERSFDSRNRSNSDKRTGEDQERKPFRSNRRDQERSYNSDNRYNSDKRNEEEQERKPRTSNRRGEEIIDPRTRNKAGNRNRRNVEDNDKSRKRFESTGDAKKQSQDREKLHKSHYSKKKQLAHQLAQPPVDGMLRLNKYIANTGACSRREADQRIADGRISVNGKVVTEVGTKVSMKDDVRMDNKRLTPEAKVYLVLNKPKDFVTTMDDPMGRKTVLSLIQNACDERIYPVGRLDRMTTGVLLFTNDGELTKKLTHPKYDKKKIYHVFLNNPISKNELQQIADGIELEDGFIQSDAISFVEQDDKRQVGIEIHSGKNRIVRRIFEHFGYEVDKLDRVFFAGITKKNLPRGRWRFLTEKEVKMLKTY